MPDYAYITDLIVGDVYTISRTIKRGDILMPLSRAWLTVKSNKNLADSEAEIQIIADLGVDGLGEVINDTEDSYVSFTVSGEASFHIAAGTSYHYDIQVKDTSSNIKTVELGILVPGIGVTTA